MTKKEATRRLIIMNILFWLGMLVCLCSIGRLDYLDEQHIKYGLKELWIALVKGGGVGAKTGLYATPTGGNDPLSNVYHVENGEIEIKGKFYPIKLADGDYIIRKLTPIECERLQTLPDGYTAAVSNSQRYKGLGNGWTAEVIIHILRGALQNISRDEEIVVLSMYDGIGTGRYCLDKMGFSNVKYYAYEIDKFAIKVAQSNYPDIIELGDAFDLRRLEWELGMAFNKQKENRADS